MSTEKRDPWKDAITRMISLTESGEIGWSLSTSIRSKRENVVGEVYTARYLEREIAVYEYRYKQYQSRAATPMSPIFLHELDPDRWFWANSVSVEFVTVNGEVDWRWPTTPNHFALLDAIRRQHSGADVFLRKLLSLDTKPPTG